MIETGKDITLYTNEEMREHGDENGFFVTYKDLCNTVKPVCLYLYLIFIYIYIYIYKIFYK